MKINLLPTTRLGKWLAGLIIAFIILLIIYYIFGNTFYGIPFVDYFLSFSVLAIVALGLAGFFIVIVAIIKDKERSVLAYLAVSLGWVIIISSITSLYGDPISKANTQRQYLEYYENTYHEEFTVYSYEHNISLSPPHYDFEIGPVNNQNITFRTSLYSQGISDSYGGILASAILIKDVTSLLKPNYDHLNFSVDAQEYPHEWKAGTSPDYFETDPSIRLLKNHFILYISWTDTTMSELEQQETVSEMFRVIESQLPYKMPHLYVNIIANSVVWSKQ